MLRVRLSPRVRLFGACQRNRTSCLSAFELGFLLSLLTRDLLLELLKMPFCDAVTSESLDHSFPGS